MFNILQTKNMCDQDEVRLKFENAIKNTLTMAGAARSLGLKFTTFKNYAVKFGLYEPNQGAKGIHVIDLEDVFSGKKTINTSVLRKRIIDQGILKYECEICGIDKWNGKEIVLELDHIDGDRRNNSLKNLRLLCLNCHSQTPTYRHKNRKPSISDNELSEAFKESNNFNQLCQRLGIQNRGQKEMKQLDSRLKEMNLRFNSNCLESIKLEESKNTKNQLKKSKRKAILPKKCPDCNKTIQRRSNRCPSCHAIERRKIERPPLGVLLKDVKLIGYVQTGQKYGVSDNSIRKWIKQYQKEKNLD